MVARDVNLPTLANVNLNQPNIRIAPTELKWASHWFQRCAAFGQVKTIEKSRAAETFPEAEGCNQNRVPKSVSH